MPANTSPTPIGDSLGTPPTGPVAVPSDLPADPTVSTSDAHVDAESPAQWTPDITAINHAQGDPAIWARQFYELVGYTTGKWIDESSLNEWLSSFAQQVVQATLRSAFFDVKNTIVPADTSGDPALQVMQFRDDLARDLRVRAGL